MEEWNSFSGGRVVSKANFNYPGPYYYSANKIRIDPKPSKLKKPIIQMQIDSLGKFVTATSTESVRWLLGYRGPCCPSSPTPMASEPHTLAKGVDHEAPLHILRPRPGYDGFCLDESALRALDSSAIPRHS